MGNLPVRALRAFPARARTVPRGRLCRWAPIRSADFLFTEIQVRSDKRHDGRSETKQSDDNADGFTPLIEVMADSHGETIPYPPSMHRDGAVGDRTDVFLSESQRFDPNSPSSPRLTCST